MKTLIKTILVAILLIAFSCSKDDDSELQPENQAPTEVLLIAPAADAENIDLNPNFSWEAATDADGDQIVYEIYADNTSTPSTLIGTTTTTSFNYEERLNLLENYNWKVIAKDNKGGESTSSSRPFQTRTIRSGIVTNNTPFTNFGRTDAFVYDNKIWQIGSVADNIGLYNSDDGENWSVVIDELPFTSITHNGFIGLRATVFNNELWVVGSSQQIVEMWHTSDGVNWTLASDVIPPRNVFIAHLESFRGNLYFFHRNDIWLSNDGITWSLLPENTLYDDFSAFETYVHDGKMYLKSGSSVRSIIYTEDGINWVDLNPNNDFNDGSRFANTVIFDNKLWEIGGDVESTINFSRDLGVTWERASTNTVFPAMTSSEVVVKGAQIFIISGKRHFLSPDDGELYNKVWVLN